GCGTSAVAIGERPRDRDGSSLREGRFDAGRIDQESLRSGIPRVPRPAALRGARRDLPPERRDDRPGVRASRVDRDARTPRPPVPGAALLRLRQLVTCNMTSKSFCNAPSGVVALIGNGKPGTASNARSRCVPTGAKGWGTKVTIRIATATMPTSFRVGSRRVRSFSGGGCRTPRISIRNPKTNQPGYPRGGKTVN